MKVQPFSSGADGERGLAFLLAESMRGAQAAAELKARGYGQAAQLAAQGIQFGMERGDRRREGEANRALEDVLSRRGEAGASSRQERGFEFQRGERAAGESFAREERGAGQAFESERQRELFTQQRALNLQDVLGSLGTAGAVHQGLDVPTLMQRFQQQAGESAPPSQIQRLGPGVPGGFPQEGATSPDPLYLALRGEPQGQGNFAGIPRVTPPPSVEAQRFQREQEIDEETMRAIGEATTFALSTDGQKLLYMPIKMSRLEALGLEDLPPDMQEAQVVRLFPEVTPAPGSMDGEEDRSKLDAHLKWLGKEIDIQVPNEAGFMQGAQYLSSRVKSPESLKAAMEAIKPDSDMKPARSLQEARESAKGFILDRMQEIKATGQPAQLQGGGDLMQALQGRATAESAAAPAQSAMWSKDLIQRAGFELGGMPELLRSAAVLGYPVGPGESGELEFQPLSDGTQASAATKAALKRFLSNKKNRAQLEQVLGAPERSQTRSEVEKGALLRENAGTQPAPARSDGRGEMAPEQAAPSGPPGMSALDAYRASKGGAEPAKKPSRTMPIPPDASLIGSRELERLMQLLGAGGGR